MSSEAMWGGFDAGNDGGGEGQDEWLYRHEGRLYGPIATQALLDRIKGGQIPEEATCARDGTEDFAPFDEIPELKDDARKAFQLCHEHQKREAAKRAKAAQRIVIAVVVVGALAAGGFFGTQWYVRDQQRKRMAYIEWQRQQEEASHPPQEPDSAKLAQSNEPDIDMDLIPLVSVKKHDKVKAQHGSHHTTQTDEGPQGCQLEQGVLMSSFRTAFPQIKSCVRAAQGSNLPEQLMLEFTIANDGKVVTFEMNENSMKGEPFNDCMKRAVMSVHYPKFAGERCNIDYPISIGRKK